MIKIQIGSNLDTPTYPINLNYLHLINFNYAYGVIFNSNTNLILKINIYKNNFMN